MDGNTRFARTFRLRQTTLDALARLAEIQTARAIETGRDPEQARCTLTNALELAVMRWASAETRADRVPAPDELREMAELLGDMAEVIETDAQEVTA